MSFKLICFIAIGGAIGATGRYVSSTAINQWMASEFAYGTLAVNIIGSFFLGAMLAALSTGWTVSDEVRSMLQVGVLGAFTTFSTFSMDAFNQITRGDYLNASVYVGGSVAFSILALVAGMALTRQFYA